MKRLALLCIMIVALSGCKLFGPDIYEQLNWDTLHRVGPNTYAKVYRWDAKKEQWRITHDKVKIPEGHFITPPKNTGN